jgi:signal transduction histidine kinase
MKASTGDLVQTYSSPTPGRRGGSGESSAPVSPTAFVHDPYELERSELEAYLQNTTYFPTKTSLLEFARRYNVPVNARTQREEIIRLCLRMIHDIPAGFAGLRAAEKEPLTHPPGNVETRKVLEDFFTSTKSEGQLESTTIKKITGGLLDSILHCHEATVLLAQVRRADASLFSQVLETCEGPIETHMRLLRNLLDFSRLGTGKVQLVSVPFHLRRCLAELMQDMAALAQQKDLELCYEIKPDVPDTLVGDQGRLRQVLSNLIENAIKFTEHGEVVVEVKSQKSKVKSQKP